MKPIRSPLKILDFAVTKMDYQFVPGDEGTPPFDEYELEIDFNVHKDKAGKEDVIQVLFTAEINKTKKPLPGYQIAAEIFSVYGFDKKVAIGEGEKKQVEGFSTLYMALNSLRVMISNFTANGPFGRYILPSIDLNDLIRKKKEFATNERNERIKTTVNKTKKKV